MKSHGFDFLFPSKTSREFLLLALRLLQMETEPHLIEDY